MRQQLRRDKDAPSVKKSITDMEEPYWSLPQSETADPRRANDLTDTEDPKKE
jgi:hypothetical protein